MQRVRTRTRLVKEFLFMFLKYYLKGRKGNTKGLDFRGVFKQYCSSFVWARAIETDRLVVVLIHQLQDL